MHKIECISVINASIKNFVNNIEQQNTAGLDKKSAQVKTG
jgi:hypothetical protein